MRPALLRPNAYDLGLCFNAAATTVIYTLSLHDALPIFRLKRSGLQRRYRGLEPGDDFSRERLAHELRSEEHTSELQSRQYLVCRLLLEKKPVVQHGHATEQGRGDESVRDHQHKAPLHTG